MNTLRAKVSVLAYSQWAHTGMISEATAEFSCSGDPSGTRHPAPLHRRHAPTASAPAAYHLSADDIASASGITLNASQTPVRLVHRDGGGDPLMLTLADAVRSCTGSLAIAAQSERDPDALLLGVRGSTRSLYVGFAPNSWIVTSELYGLIGDTEHYLRLSGAPRHTGTEGSVAILHRNANSPALKGTTSTADRTPSTPLT